MNGKLSDIGRARPAAGFSLVEVLVAAVLLMVVFFGLAQTHARARRQLDYEEDRRKASAVAQWRLDGIRRDYRYDDLVTLNGVDTTYVVDDRTYRVTLDVTSGAPEAQATLLAATVTWTAKVADDEVDRSLTTTTILARGLPWE